MNNNDFLSKLWAEYSVNGLVFADGSMSAYLSPYSDNEHRYESMMVPENPGSVIKCHADYLKSGSAILCTNTFKLDRRENSNFRNGHSCRAICMQAPILAKAAIGNQTKVQIWGGIGIIEEDHKYKDDVHCYQSEMEWLMEGGASAILVESVNRMKDIDTVLHAADKANAPVILLVNTDDVGALPSDETPTLQALHAAEDAGASAVGISHSSNFELMDKIINSAYLQLHVPIVAKPAFNTDLNGRPLSRSSAITITKWAIQAYRLYQSGAQVIGGGNGTSPKHIHALWMRALVEAQRDATRNSD